MAGKGSKFGILDSVVVVFISSALVLFVLWLGATVAGMPILDKLPDWLSKLVSSVWTWLTTGAAAGAALRYRLRQTTGALPNYPLAIAGTTMGIICLVLVMPLILRRVAPPAPGVFLLKLRVTLAESQRPPSFSFIQRDPNWLEPQGLAPLDANLYQIRIDLPQPAGRFRAALIPRNEVGGTLTDNLHPTPLDVCFVRAPRDPLNGLSHYYARIDCQLGGGCSAHTLEDPGWAKDCPPAKTRLSHPLSLIPAAYAAVLPETERGWLVPSLPTLRKLRETKKIGYTEFLIRSGPMKGVVGSNYLTYDIAVNGTPVSIDGWRSDDLRVPIDPTKGIELPFGLENLSFSGADRGCETISVQIKVFERDKALKSYVLFRKYAALRDAAEVTIAADDGLSFRWNGKYLNPNVGERCEVFVGSTPDARYAGQIKARIDRVKSKYEGQDLVGVIRPPLNSSNYGVVVGLRQASGQVHFVFDNRGAEALVKWIQIGKGDAAFRSAFPMPVFTYRTRADEGVPRFRPCAEAGSRP